MDRNYQQDSTGWQPRYPPRMPMHPFSNFEPCGPPIFPNMAHPPPPFIPPNMMPFPNVPFSVQHPPFPAMPTSQSSVNSIPQNNSALEATSHYSEFERQKHKDKEWIDQWLNSKEIVRKSSKVMTVSEARCFLVEALTALKELKFEKEKMEHNIEASDEMWQSMKYQAYGTMNKIDTIGKNFVDETCLKNLKRKIEMTKKRRERLKRRKQENNAIKKEIERERDEKEKVIDRNLEQIREKYFQTMRACEMKEEADSILAEVKKKIMETRKAQERIVSLEKYRSVQKDAYRRKGLFTPIESDQIFVSKIEVLKKLLKTQLEEYEAEMKALEVMLETEHEDQKEKEMARKAVREQELVLKKQKNINECLFGNEVVPEITDPMYYFWQFYNQGSTSMEGLLRVRQQWDMFLVPPDSQTGMFIPYRWVTPNESSSDEWSAYLKKS